MKKLIITSWLWLSCLLFTIASIPAGYYQSANNLNKYALKDALNTIVSTGTFLEYGSGPGHTWTGFYYTDRDASTNKITDMYSDSLFYQTDPNSSVHGMHIEHSMPKSWWGGMDINTYANCDLFHIYPSEDQINMSKSNKPLGENDGETRDNSVSQCGANTFESDQYSGPCFEPADEFKGDFARSYFYVATAYGELANLNTFDTSEHTMLASGDYPWFKQWAIDLLLKWDRQDPISQKELDRQEIVFGIQHNRNPFIDFANLAEYIWGNKKDENFIIVGDIAPYISTPTRYNTIEFGTLFTNASSIKNITIKGSNFRNSVTLTNSNNAITLSKNILTSEQVETGFQLSLTIQSSTPSIINDTLIIQSDELIESIKVPITARITNNFRVFNSTDVGITSAQLNWMTVPNTTSYDVTIYENAAPHMGDLIITTYIEGSSYNKVIEIYNATGSAVDLSEYALARTDNGKKDYSNFQKTLTGSLANNTHYIIASSKVDPLLIPNADLLLDASSADDSDKATGFNGDDAVALIHNGEIIDEIGLLDGEKWGENATYSRKPGIHAPSSQFDNKQWIKSAINDISTLGTFTFTATNPTSQIVTSNTNLLVVDNLKPATTYYVSAKANGTTVNESTNLIGFTTLDIPAPIALEATNVASTKCTANWEKIDDLDNYEVDIFTLSGSGAVSDTTDFTNNTLPSDWTFSGSLGWYTTATSTGVSTPSLKLSTDGDMLTSKEYPGAITSVSFMARYTSSRGKNNTLSIEVKSNGNWIAKDTIKYANTAKTTYTIKCNSTENISAVRWTFNKVTYNMAVDDIIINYGSSVRTYIQQNTPAIGKSLEILALIPTTTYYYVVRGKISDQVSKNSNVQSVTTLLNDDTKKDDVSNEKVIIYANNQHVNISNLGSDAVAIQLFDATGRCIYNSIAHQQIEINVANKGIYIVRIKNKTYKVVL